MRRSVGLGLLMTLACPLVLAGQGVPAADSLAKAASAASAANTVAINFVWTLVAGFLVMFMQAGFAMVETGFTRAKNAAHTITMNFMVYGIAMLAYWAIGFALQAGGVGALGTLGGYDKLAHEVSITIAGEEWGLFGGTGFFLTGVAYTAPVFAYFLFQMVFMDTAATIPTGALAERWKFSAFAVFSVFVGAVIYPIYANWTWGGGWIDERPDEHAEHGECRELPALGQRARGNRGRGVHEHHLEQEVREHRGGIGDAGEEEPRPAEQPPLLATDRERDFMGELVVAAERAERADTAGLQCKADDPVRQHRDAVDHEVHGDRVRGIFGAREPGLDHREPGLHEHDKEPGDEGPHEIDGDRIRRRGGVRGCGERIRRDCLRRQDQRTGQRQHQTNADRALHAFSRHTVSQSGGGTLKWCTSFRAEYARIMLQYATTHSCGFAMLY